MPNHCSIPPLWPPASRVLTDHRMCVLIMLHGEECRKGGAVYEVNEAAKGSSENRPLPREGYEERG